MRISEHNGGEKVNLKETVKVALIKKRWSQRELARQMTISPAYLQDILVGNRTPLERLQQIEAMLEIDLSNFYPKKVEV